MPILARASLQKLQIEAYRSRKRLASEKELTFTAMYNPESISQAFRTQFNSQQALGSSGQTLLFSSNKPVDLMLQLIIDGTGAEAVGKSPQSITKQVDAFLKTAYYYQGEIHAPYYLSVKWGDRKFWGAEKFDCRLVSANIVYTSFDRDGAPLRAELDLTLRSDEDPGLRAQRERKSSPDLTHQRIIKSGDTLPMLCNEIYGDPNYYIQVASANQLDNFRQLTPGQTLYFPPIDQQ